MGSDTEKILSALNNVSAEKALELLERVKNNPGVPLPKKTDQTVLKVLVRAGLIDQSGIQVRGSTRVREFPTLPHLWGVFQAGAGKSKLDNDLVDDAKLFLNSIRYGEFYSPPSRGQIWDPALLVSKLISRGEIGPASAIGSDYPMPLSRGIVSIVESRIKPGRFHMQFRKKDVAQSVLDMLEQGSVLASPEEADDRLLGTTGQYHSPELVRINQKLPSTLQNVQDELAFLLRSHRKNL